MDGFHHEQKNFTVHKTGDAESGDFLLVFCIGKNLFFHMWIKNLFSQHLYLIFIRSIRFFRFCCRRNIGSFEDFKGTFFKVGMMNNIVQGIKSNLSESEIFMPVFCCTGRFLLSLIWKTAICSFRGYGQKNP